MATMAPLNLGPSEEACQIPLLHKPLSNVRGRWRNYLKAQANVHAQNIYEDQDWVGDDVGATVGLNTSFADTYIYYN